MLKLITAPSVEPVSIAEAMAYCRIDASNHEPAPGIITAALASPAVAGNVDNGVHRYLATFVTADGETEAGTISAAVTVADKTVNGKVTLTAIPLGGALVTSRKLYRTAAGGSTYLLLATLADNTTTTYTDNIADSALGAGAPSTNTTNDPLLTQIIASVRQTVEERIGRALITQTREKVLDAFPECIYLERPPVASVTSVKYIDIDGVEQTLSASLYQVDTESEPARVKPAYGQTWPATRAQDNAVRVRYVCGYGASASVPQPIRSYMLLRIKHAYDQRDPVNVGNIVTEFPDSFVDGLIDDYRVVSTYQT